MGKKKSSIGLTLLLVLIIGLIITVMVLTIYVIMLKNEKLETEQSQVNIVSESQEISNAEKDDEEVESGIVVDAGKETKELIEKYYKIAEDLYFLRNEEIKIDDSNYPSPQVILNYEEVAKKYLSERLFKIFAPFAVYKEDGKYYREITGSVEGYKNLRFENIVVSPDKITCTVVFDLYVGDDEVLKEDAKSSFSIVKENEEWKIDEYQSDYMVHNGEVFGNK